MVIMTHAKFHFNRLMLTLIFGIWVSEPPSRSWRTTENAGPDRVNFTRLRCYVSFSRRFIGESELLFLDIKIRF